MNDLSPRAEPFYPRYGCSLIWASTTDPTKNVLPNGDLHSIPGRVGRQPGDYTFICRARPSTVVHGIVCAIGTIEVGLMDEPASPARPRTIRRTPLSLRGGCSKTRK